MLGAFARTEKLDLPIACVAERHFELAVLAELAALDPVGGGDGDVEERAGPQSFGTLDAGSDIAGGNRVLLRELQAELVEDIAWHAFLDMRKVKLLQQGVQHAVARFHRSLLRSSSSRL